MTHLEQKNDGLEIKKRRKEGRKRKILLHENLDFSRMDSLVIFRASSGRGESLTLEVAIRGKLLSKLNSRNRFLISKYGRCTKNLQRSELSISTNFQLSYCVAHQFEIRFYVNLRAQTISTRSLPCIVEEKRREEV